MHDFQKSLPTSGFADHPGIAATGVMQADPTVEQVLEMAPFARALQRKRAERREFEHSQEHRQAPLPPTHEEELSVVLSAGAELSRAMRRT